MSFLVAHPNSFELLSLDVPNKIGIGAFKSEKIYCGVCEP
jgi:hypothetical protein